MNLTIDNTKTIKELQDQFSSAFSFLKIEFFPNRFRWEGFYNANDRFASHLSINAIRKVNHSGTIEINMWHKIGEIENQIYNRFGLNVQIYFKSGRKWIQTSKSDHLTIYKLQMVIQQELVLLL